MIPLSGVTIFKTDQSTYIVLWQKKIIDHNAPHFPNMLGDESDPLNYYTVDGQRVRFYLMGVPTIGNELKIKVYTTFEKVIEFLQTLEVLQ
jgi:hypothetical protein